MGKSVGNQWIFERAVVFGGLGEDGALGDTWEWDGKTWRERNPARSPAAGYGGALVYDPKRHRLVLFGDDTVWEWDGEAWTPRVGAAPESARRRIRPPRDSWRERLPLVYDVERDAFISSTAGRSRAFMTYPGFTVINEETPQ